MLTPGLYSPSLFSASCPPPTLRLHHAYRILIYGEISWLKPQTILYLFPHFLLPFTARYLERTFILSLPLLSSFSLVPIKVLSHPLLRLCLSALPVTSPLPSPVLSRESGEHFFTWLLASTLRCFSSLTSYSLLVSFDDLPNLCMWECSKAWSLTLFSSCSHSLGDWSAIFTLMTSKRMSSVFSFTSPRDFKLVYTTVYRRSALGFLIGTSHSACLKLNYFLLLSSPLLF